MPDYSGKDNYGKPRQNFLDALEDLSDEDLSEKTEELIWLSAFANNNPRSDYHWQADACYDEWQRREKPEQYQKVFDEVKAGL